MSEKQIPRAARNDKAKKKHPAVSNQQSAEKEALGN
jgi:hypothetical protein